MGTTERSRMGCDHRRRSDLRRATPAPSRKWRSARIRVKLTSLGATELKLWDVASGRQLRNTPLVAENDRAGRATPDQTVTALTLDGRLAAVAGGPTTRSGFWLSAAESGRTLFGSSRRQTDAKSTPSSCRARSPTADRAAIQPGRPVAGREVHDVPARHRRHCASKLGDGL